MIPIHTIQGAVFIRSRRTAFPLLISGYVLMNTKSAKNQLRGPESAVSFVRLFIALIFSA